MATESDEELDYRDWLGTVRRRRERAQGRWLVGVVGTALGILFVEKLISGLTLLDGRTLGAISGISLVFALAAWGLRAATPWAAVFGGVICFLLTLLTGRSDEMVLRSGLTPLLLLFVLTFAAGKMGRRRKVVVEVQQERHGRQASQVIANLGMAGLCVGSVAWLDSPPAQTLSVLMLAVLAEATADTVSSEIGQAFGGTPWMLTTLRRVAPGTDGAVSLVGTGAGVLAAGIVVGCGGWAMNLPPARWGVALTAGVLGLVFDSLLGATVERRGWLGNDLVNFTSTAFSAGAAGLLLRVFLSP